ncbi:hypothetical protein [Chamaesiphon sp. VAR_48_metabat_403]|uniref:hypothetical protein n=1 Tax=Chamaesiphon sp. VAR_48_metabat_403 TaxID=2964700 RepID=UPI00286EA7AC|nr:hypothetical protein [Chamaesiphon sp. VAR_48_metabat_403]
MNQNRFGSGTSTLGEAIHTLRAAQAAGDLTDRFSVELERSFDRHDAIHILFDCGNSIQDEIAVHIWMIFATTVDIKEMHHAVADREHRNVLAGIGHFKLLGTWLVALPRIVIIIFKSLRMKKKLAVEELSKLKQQSIDDIHREHGIVL